MTYPSLLGLGVAMAPRGGPHWPNRELHKLPPQDRFLPRNNKENPASKPPQVANLICMVS